MHSSSALLNSNPYCSSLLFNIYSVLATCLYSLCAFLVCIMFYILVMIYSLRSTCWDFPGGPMVKNPPSNAGDVGSIPGQGSKSPHAEGQLSLRASNY